MPKKKHEDDEMPGKKKMMPRPDDDEEDEDEEEDEPPPDDEEDEDDEEVDEDEDEGEDGEDEEDAKPPGKAKGGKPPFMKSKKKEHKQYQSNVSFRIGTVLKNWDGSFNTNPYMQIQAIDFDAAKYGILEARKWLSKNSFWGDQFTEDDGVLRFILRDEKDFSSTTLKTVPASAKYAQRHFANIKYFGQMKAERVRIYEKMFSILGVEIFKVGRWNGDDYQQSDLDEMVRNFNKVGFKPPVKLGHDEKSGDQAFGWIDKIYRKGEKLFADFIDIPEKVYKLIKDRGYDAVSSEVFWNLERNGKTYRRALKAVALLGAETPAVSDLAPLRTVVASLPTTGFGRLVTYTMKRTKEENSMRTYQEVSSDIRKFRNELNTAEQDADRLREQAAAGNEDAQRRLSDLQTKIADYRQKLDSFSDELLEISGGLAGTIAEQGAQIKTLADSHGRIMEERRAQSIETRVAKCSLPALRPLLTAAYDAASKSNSVGKYTVTADGKTTTEEMTGEAVLDKLVEEINSLSSKLFKQERVPTNKRSDGSTVNDENPTIELDRLTKEHMAKTNSKDYSASASAVLLENKELNERYRNWRSH